MAEDSKSSNKPDEAAPPSASGTSQKSTNKPLVIISVIVLAVSIVVIAIGAVIITQLRNTINTIDAIKNVSQAQSTRSDHSTNTAESGAAHAKTNSYVDLETTTVNLRSENGNARFLQLKMTLTVADEKLSEVVKKKSPEIRSRLIMLLSTYTAATLETEKGKHELSDAITIAINQILEPHSANVQKAMQELQKPNPDSEVLQNLKMNLPVKDVLFSSFFIQ